MTTSTSYIDSLAGFKNYDSRTNTPSTTEEKRPMFKVTFNVSAARLERLLAATTRGGFVSPEILYDQALSPGAPVLKPPKPRPKKLKRRIAQPTDILSLTGKKATRGSNRERILTSLEVLEKKHGVGKVTRALLNEACNALSIDTQIVGQLTAENYIKR